MSIRTLSMLAALWSSLTMSGMASAQSPAAASTESRLRSEAIVKARAYWDTQITNCSGSYVARSWYADRSGGDIEQLTNVIFSVQPRMLAEADRLNGLEWDGLALANGTSRRTRHFSSLAPIRTPYSARSPYPRDRITPPAAWTKWEPSDKPVWTLHLRKESGQWQVAPVRLDRADYLDFEKWPCTDAEASEKVRAEIEAWDERDRRITDMLEASRKRTKVIGTFDAYTDHYGENHFSSAELTDVDAFGKFDLGGIVEVSDNQLDGRGAPWGITLQYHGRGTNGWVGEMITFKNRAVRDQFVTSLVAAISAWREKYNAVAEVSYNGNKATVSAASASPDISPSATPGGAPVANSAPAEAIMAQLIAIERRATDLQKRGDRDSIEKLIDPGFSGTFNGRSFSRPVFLASLKAQPQIISSVLEDPEIRLETDRAALSGTWIIQIRQGSRTNVVKQRFTDVFVQKEGRWLLLRSDIVQ